MRHLNGASFLLGPVVQWEGKLPVRLLQQLFQRDAHSTCDHATWLLERLCIVITIIVTIMTIIVIFITIVIMAAYTSSITMAMTKHWSSWAKTVTPPMSASSKLVVKHRGTDAHPSCQVCHDMQQFYPDVLEWREGCQQANHPVMSMTANISSICACCKTVLTQICPRSDDAMQCCEWPCWTVTRGQQCQQSLPKKLLVWYEILCNEVIVHNA